MLNLKLLAHFLYQMAIEIHNIIRDNYLWNTEPTNDIGVNKINHHFFGHWLESCCFYPLYEIINGNQDEPMSIRGLWFNWSNYVNSPSHKRSWRCQPLKFHWGQMTNIPISLTIMTLLHEFDTIWFHGQPKVPLSSYLFSQDHPIYIGPTNACIYSFYNHLSHVLIDISQVYSSWHYFMQYTIVTDKLSW